MNDFPIEELDRLPYVDEVPRDGRQVLLQSYYDDATGDWYSYFMPRKGWLGRVAGGEVWYGAYFARSAADSMRDLELAISTLVTQHLAYPRVLDRLRRFENDVQNCAAVIEKYHLISEASTEKSSYASVVVTTELEYLLALVRAMYDLLNEMVKSLAPLLVTLTDEQRRVVTRTLPTSFADVAMYGDDLRNGDEIVERRKLPPALANWYVMEGPAFRVLRKLRDAVIHRGEYPPTVYDLPDRGLAVARDEYPWTEFAFWEDVEAVNGRLVPLRLAFVAFVHQLIGASERLASALASCIQLPPAIGTDVRVYLRSAVTHRLVAVPEMLRRPWERLDYDNPDRAD